jgi:hypothetical protein
LVKAHTALSRKEINIIPASILGNQEGTNSCPVCSRRSLEGVPPPAQ